MNYNIIFHGFNNDDKSGIYYYSNGTSEIENVVLLIIDSYSGLTYYRDTQNIHPGVMYFMTHGQIVKNITFIILDESETEILLKVNSDNNSGLDVESVDIHNKLKNYNIQGIPKYSSLAIPLYEIFFLNSYDHGDCKVMPNDIVFDVGGNIGLFSYYSICKNARKVYYFEPSNKMFEIATSNLNSFDNIVFENVAVSDSTGTTDFFYNSEFPGLSTMDSLNSGVANRTQCNSVNIMDYLLKNGIENIDYLKLDCEGSEYQIFEALSFDYLSNHIHKIAIEYHNNEDKRLNLILDKLSKCEFTFEYGNSFSIDNVSGMLYAINKKWNINEYYI
jgi:FkbM family methyltransferase